MAPILRGFVLPHATSIAFLVAYGEFAIGIALTLGILVRAASACGLVFMLTLLFSSDYPGAAAPAWQYFGASLSHSVFALCFLVFLLGQSAQIWSVPACARIVTITCSAATCYSVESPSWVGTSLEPCYLLPAGFKTAVFRSSPAMIR